MPRNLTEVEADRLLCLAAEAKNIAEAAGIGTLRIQVLDRTYTADGGETHYPAVVSAGSTIIPDDAVMRAADGSAWFEWQSNGIHYGTRHVNLARSAAGRALLERALRENVDALAAGAMSWAKPTGGDGARDTIDDDADKGSP